MGLHHLEPKVFLGSKNKEQADKLLAGRCGVGPSGYLVECQTWLGMFAHPRYALSRAQHPQKEALDSGAVWLDPHCSPATALRGSCVMILIARIERQLLHDQLECKRKRFTRLTSPHWIIGIFGQDDHLRKRQSPTGGLRRVIDPCQSHHAAMIYTSLAIRSVEPNLQKPILLASNQFSLGNQSTVLGILHSWTR